MPDTPAVLGAGAWGSAIAALLCRHHKTVWLWGRSPERMRTIGDRHENPDYLPGITLPAGIKPASDLEQVCEQAGWFVLAVPSAALSETLATLVKHGRQDAVLLSTIKGFEHDSGRLPSETAEARGFDPTRFAVLSGPSFAAETAAGKPTAVALACSDAELAEELAAGLRGPAFRVYTSEDVIGVQLGGVLKNVIAIAAGVCDGLACGDNARAALISRGLAEMTRFTLAAGGKTETMLGLAGLGDLLLTCTGDQSRNRKLGLHLGRGGALAELSDTRTVEGRYSVRAVYQRMQALGVSMPITEQVYRVLYEGVAPRQAVGNLLARGQSVEY